jgi:hypothetical protein
MFTSSCFIRKNTPELINKLIDLGYVKALFDEEYTKSESYGLIVDQGDIAPLEHPLQEDELMFTYNFFDCGTNEELFLAIAALRDDKPDYQWFLWEHNDGEYHTEENDSWRQYIPGEHWEEWWWFEVRKATVEELIEFFKEK